MAEEEQQARVYLGNLPADADLLEIYSICAAFGAVQAVEVREGIAFVDFASPESRDRLISTYNGKDFHGKTLKVEAAKASLSKSSNTVHVIRLPEGTTEASLTERVRACGNVTKVQISEPHPFVGLHGSVVFDSNDAAQKCVAQFADGAETQAFIQYANPPRRGRSSTSRPRRAPGPKDAAGEAGAAASPSPAAATGVGAAADATGARAEQFTLSLLVPLAYAGAIIGKGGEVIKGIKRDTHALLTLAPLPHPIPRSITERLSQIKGFPEEVVAAFRAVAEILYAQSLEKSIVPLRILVPAELVGHIIGKAGAQIKALKAQVQCTIDIEVCTQSEYASTFWLVSADASVEDSVKIVQTLVDRMSTVVQRGNAFAVDPMKVNQEESVTLILPSSAMGAVIGKGGAVLREISAQSQAVIEIEKAGETPATADVERQVWISGPVAALERAQHMISSCLQGKDVEIKYQLSIPSSVIGHIIGKRGVRINAIMDETRTEIDIEESGATATVTILGSVINSINAQRIVRKIVEERES
eukprot:m.230775 g.230775  ORF g.230775 m.230775 type:complete len:531 (+) comp18148_c0_seq1:40-1632(+)